MHITFILNGVQRTIDIAPRETLFHMLRRLGIHSVKFGSEDGTAGYSTVLVDGHLRSSVVMLAAQVDDKDILTVEGLSGHQRPGWHHKDAWHPLQRAFIEMAAIQSGYDTPALILAGKALLDRNPSPT
ncbi:MAG: 2Fe-2S iron-sulfur cluster-binding protein, partial [Anaerolineae bacterium]|nr:2Fe-2S iron-sulfur cluster-binding protein [Anaerolineae bacterium]